MTSRPPKVRTALAAALTAPLLASSAWAATSCNDLAKVVLPSTTITGSDARPAGEYTPPGSPKLADLPAFCRVQATVAPVPGSRIGIELWLPHSDWNGKIEMFGNGGYSSKISFDLMAGQLKRGYAVLGTDTGHTGDDPDFAAGRPEAIADWGHRAVHEAITAAKPLTAAFYGKDAQHSYFAGCSTGGHQALMEAQRYPADFDGIIAGDPGHNRTHLNAGFLWQFVTNHRKPDMSEIIPPSKLAVISAAAVKACRGRDGGLASDNFLTDPEACDFEPRTLQCKTGDGPDCLTPEQVGALEKMYAGARNPRTGERIYPGWPKGSENSGKVLPTRPGWSLYWADPAHADRPARASFWKIWAFDDPSWDWRSFDFDQGMKSVDEKLASGINAMNPDLSAFKARGGKLLQYHGLADPVVPPRDSIDYYERVQRAEAKGAAAPVDVTADWYRLFLVPGMEHCRGGEGATVFDAQGALEAWVERGAPPATITATKYANDNVGQGAAFSRPLCPYPAIASLKDGGDPTDAASFTCAPGRRYPEPLAAAAYQR